jgi:hypothetical protein
MLHFLGIGAQKAGTTWLYEQLRQHPQLAFPLGKEAHFWNRPHGAAEVAAYLERFAQVGAVAGEITPAYGMLPIAVVREIYSIAPHLRLIYLVRNPMRRAWSSALMALQRAELTLEEASDQWFIDHFRSAGSMMRGDYQTCIQTWRAVFPSEQLLVLRFEHIADTPETLLNICFQHVGVSCQDTEQLQTQGCHRAVFSGPGYKLRPSLEPMLRALYEERIQRLADYLDTDLSAWLTF